jgi:restriction system protein
MLAAMGETVPAPPVPHPDYHRRMARSRRPGSRPAFLLAALFWLLAVLLALLVLERSEAFRALPGPGLLVLVLTGLAALWVLLRALGLDGASRRRRRLLGVEPEDLDRMSGPGFEEWVAERLRIEGDSVWRSPAGGDFGVDLVVTVDGVRVAVEAKRWKGTVPNGVVRSLIAGAGYHACRAGLVVTTAKFSAKARAQAARTDLPLALIGRSELPELPAALRELADRARALSADAR